MDNVLQLISVCHQILLNNVRISFASGKLAHWAVISGRCFTCADIETDDRNIPNGFFPTCLILYPDPDMRMRFRNLIRRRGISALVVQRRRLNTAMTKEHSHHMGVGTMLLLFSELEMETCLSLLFKYVIFSQH